MRKPKSLLFLLGRTLEEKFPELLGAAQDGMAIPVDIAVDEWVASARRIEHEIVAQLAAINPGDYDKLLDILSELLEIVEHQRDHLTKARRSLWKLTEKVSVKLRQLSLDNKNPSRGRRRSNWHG